MAGFKNASGKARRSAVPTVAAWVLDLRLVKPGKSQLVCSSYSQRIDKSPPNRGSSPSSIRTSGNQFGWRASDIHMLAGSARATSARSATCATDGLSKDPRKTFHTADVDQEKLAGSLSACCQQSRVCHCPHVSLLLVMTRRGVYAEIKFTRTSVIFPAAKPRRNPAANPGTDATTKLTFFQHPRLKLRIISPPYTETCKLLPPKKSRAPHPAGCEAVLSIKL
ncbi:hypothetical protein DFH08DRAFT_800249 [Mycena albidolilacea]|uniref:Uncharacterized protein n=1 Tax=Mycena albidolilacea TaxID=1033008 RepID=A0AAD7AJL7_9AGAR|nr:hypothetical protein DFH08DRAFT_800249 [Mycena albidolilacea]